MLKWENSDERNRWIEKGRKLTEDEGKIEKLTGMEFWFTPFTFRNPRGQGQVPLTPPRYKMAIVTTAVIFIMLTTIIPLVHKLNEEIPSLLRILMETSIIVVLMTYVIMPNVTQVLSPWLSKRNLFQGKYNPKRCYFLYSSRICVCLGDARVTRCSTVFKVTHQSGSSFLLNHKIVSLR